MTTATEIVRSAEQPTLQQILEASIERFSDDRGQAATVTGSGSVVCIYKTVDGNRCVVGNLMNAEEISRLGAALGGAQILIDEGKLDRFEVFSDELAVLQYIHDDLKSWNGHVFEGWGELRDWALDYRLDTSNIPD